MLGGKLDEMGVMQQELILLGEQDQGWPPSCLPCPIARLGSV